MGEFSLFETKRRLKWDDVGIVRVYIYMRVSINGGTPIVGVFISWKILLKLYDLGVPPFMETHVYIYTYVYIYTIIHIYIYTYIYIHI